MLKEQSVHVAGGRVENAAGIPMALSHTHDVGPQIGQITGAETPSSVERARKIRLIAAGNAGLAALIEQLLNPNQNLIA